LTQDPTYLRASFIAKASVPLFLAIGIIEILSGSFSGSVGLVSDGVHTLSDGLVSGIVWIGLRFARRGPDGKFHFGYYNCSTDNRTYKISTRSHICRTLVG